MSFWYSKLLSKAHKLTSTSPYILRPVNVTPDSLIVTVSFELSVSCMTTPLVSGLIVSPVFETFIFL